MRYIKYLLIVFLLVALAPTSSAQLRSLKNTDRYWEIAAGEVGRFEVINKFGRNPDVDTGTDPEDIWSQGGTYTYLTTGTQLFLSSSNAGDTIDITVEGLDENWDPKTETTTLTGQTQVALPGLWMRVFRAFNADSDLTDGVGTDLLGDVYVATTDAAPGGVPAVATKIKAKIDVLFQQTHMTHYAIPRWHTGYITEHYMTLNSATGVAILNVEVREFGNVFRSMFIVGLDANADSSFKYPFFAPFVIPQRTDIKFVAQSVSADDSDINAGYQLILEDWRGDM